MHLHPIPCTSTPVTHGKHGFFRIKAKVTNSCDENLDTGKKNSGNNMEKPNYTRHLGEGCTAMATMNTQDDEGGSETVEDEIISVSDEI